MLHFHFAPFPVIICRLLLYPEDNHALDKPATEADSWINIALWLQSSPAGAAVDKGT